MSVSYMGHLRRDGHARAVQRPWIAKGRHRELQKDLYLGAFATKEEAQAAVAAFYQGKYGPGDRRRRT
jgi:hypothetical protein